MFSIPGNPPIAASADLRNGTLTSLGVGLSPGAVPQLVTFQYDAKVPASWQWQAGVQMALPWASSLDVSYVGNRGVNRLGGLQGGNVVNFNAVDIGAAYRPENQNPTLPTPSTVPGANAYVQNLLRGYKGLAAINQNTTEFWDLYHSIQTTFQRRFQNGFSFGANYTLGLVLDGNTGLTTRFQHAADGTVSVRSDQGQYEELFKQLNLQRHLLKLNAVWDMPDMNLSGAGAAKKVVGHIVNDWQLSGIYTGNSGNRYDLGFSFQNNGANVNMTGSQDFGARIVYVGDPGSGCSDDQYRQFNVTAVTAPSYGSVGLESGRNIMIGCPNRILDLSLARTIRLGASRQLQFRIDAFNALNTVVYTNRNSTINWADADEPDGQQLADPAGRLAQSGAFDASQRRLRRGDRRGCDAELPGDDSLPVLVLARSARGPGEEVSSSGPDHVGLPALPGGSLQ